MLSTGANVIMVSSGANVIIWDDNKPLFIFPENFTHSILEHMPTPTVT
jgi:hypothetical protein